MEDLGCMWLFGHRSKSVGAGLASQPIDWMPALSVTQQSRCSCSYRWWRHISVIAFTF